MIIIFFVVIILLYLLFKFNKKENFYSRKKYLINKDYNINKISNLNTLNASKICIVNDEYKVACLTGAELKNYLELNNFRNNSVCIDESCIDNDTSKLINGKKHIKLKTLDEDENFDNKYVGYSVFDANTCKNEEIGAKCLKAKYPKWETRAKEIWAESLLYIHNSNSNKISGPFIYVINNWNNHTLGGKHLGKYRLVKDKNGHLMAYEGDWRKLTDYPDKFDYELTNSGNLTNLINIKRTDTNTGWGAKFWLLYEPNPYWDGKNKVITDPNELKKQLNPEPGNEPKFVTQVGIFKCNGRVRYGLGDKWSYNYKSFPGDRKNVYVCSNFRFGDPDRSTRKICQCSPNDEADKPKGSDYRFPIQSLAPVSEVNDLSKYRLDAGELVKDLDINNKPDNDLTSSSDYSFYSKHH